MCNDKWGVEQEKVAIVQNGYTSEGNEAFQQE